MKTYIIQGTKTGGQVVRIVQEIDGYNAQLTFRNELNITSHLTILPYTCKAANLMSPNHRISPLFNYNGE